MTNSLELEDWDNFLMTELFHISRRRLDIILIVHGFCDKIVSLMLWDENGRRWRRDYFHIHPQKATYTVVREWGSNCFNFYWLVADSL